jgi:hypothetical protein
MIEAICFSETSDCLINLQHYKPEDIDQYTEEHTG